MERPRASYIDHTLLKPEATAAEIARVIAEAREHGFASVCIPPVYVPLAAEGLAHSLDSATLERRLQIRLADG